MSAAWQVNWQVSSFSFLRDAPGMAVINPLPIDIDGDGDLDVVTTGSVGFSEEQMPIRIFQNDGVGGFTDATEAFFGTDGPGAVAIYRHEMADFNGDGRPDLFLADFGMDADPFPGGQNVLLLSDGLHGFVDATDRLPQVQAGNHATAAGDVDDDGDIDILVFTGDGEGVGTREPPFPKGTYALLNDGLGHFTRDDDRLPPEIRYGDSAYAVYTSLLFDANGDDLPDLFLGQGYSSPDNSTRLLFGDGTGHYSLADQIVFPDSLVSEPVVDASYLDLNGDGSFDLLLTLQEPAGTAHIKALINDGHGVFTDETATRLPPTGDAYHPQLVDFNGDGFLDFILAGGPDGLAPFFLNDGTGHFTRLPDTFQGGTVEVTPFDANGDGRTDLLVQLFDLTKIQFEVRLQIDDPAPVFSTDSSATVTENLPTGNFVYDANANDDDDLTYSLTGPDAGRFTIDGGNGAVNFLVSPNFDAPADADGNNRYDIVVHANDGFHDVTKAVAITVLDQNDLAPVFASSSVATVVENIAISTVIYAANAIDGDGTPANRTITYSLSGIDAIKFSIEASTGEVRFHASPDFEAPTDVGANNQYDIIVHANDGVHDTEKAVVIAVTDQNDGPTSGDDVIVGTAAGEVITGGNGNDILTGGLGEDGFLFDTKPNKNTNLDHITDFEPRVDTIELDRSIFKKLKVPALKKKEFFKGNDIGDAGKKALIAYDKGSGELAYVAGKKDIIFAILDDSPNTLSHKDFVVVA